MGDPRVDGRWSSRDWIERREQARVKVSMIVGGRNMGTLVCRPRVLVMNSSVPVRA